MDKAWGKAAFLTTVATSLYLGGAPRANEPAGVPVQGPAPPQRLIVEPTLRAAPPTDVMVKNYPVAAWNNQVAGSVGLLCKLLVSGDLTACSVYFEEPKGSGFAATALALAPLYKLNPRTVDGAPVEGSIKFRIEFPAAPRIGEPVANAVPVDHQWQSCADITQPQASFYPKRAIRVNQEGSADIECRLDPAGAGLTACTWISESPPNYGFGDAAAKMGCLRHFQAAAPAGASPGERIYKTTVSFKVPAK